METEQSRVFRNQLFIAYCGESMDDFKARVEKESNEKRLVDKTLSTQKLLRLKRFSIAEIAYMLDFSECLVEEIQSKMD